MKDRKSYGEHMREAFTDTLPVWIGCGLALILLGAFWLYTERMMVP